MLVLCVAALVAAGPGCPAAPATPEDRRPDRTRLRIVSYNVEWLFCGCDGRGPWTSPEEAQQHLEEIGDVIAEIKPDILAMQEVQNCDMLRRLAEYLSTKHSLTGYRPYLVPGTDTATGQNVGLLSLIDPFTDVVRTANRVAFPVPGTTCGTNTGTSAVSKHFVARFRVNNVAMAFIGMHFVAFPLRTDRCLQREAQASVLRGLVDERLKEGEQVVVLGDMNDYSDRVLDFPDNNRPVSRVMRIIRDGLPTSNTSVPLHEARASFNEQLGAVPWESRYTCAYSGTRLSAIDHILLSTPLWNRVRSVNIWHGYPRDTVSDHWPVIVDLNTPLSDEVEVAAA